jgi:hypothetical protein
MTEPNKSDKTLDLTKSSPEYRDRLPEDLDITRAQAAYHLPSMSRRRWYAGFAWIISAISLLLWFVRGDRVFVNSAFLILGICLAALGVAFWLAGWSLDIREVDAVSRAASTARFPIGHIAAQLGWQGIRSRPTWRVLLYSAENPPRERAVVLVDGVNGHIVFAETEANPEDWSAELAAASSQKRQ